MRKIFVWFGIVISCSTFIHAFNPPDGSVILSGDSKIVTLSTTASSPTQLLTRDSFIQRNFIINKSTCDIAISSVSTGVVFGASTIIPGNGAAANPPIIFSPDGVNSPYWGALYGASNCGTPPTCAIFRTK